MTNVGKMLKINLAGKVRNLKVIGEQESLFGFNQLMVKDISKNGITYVISDNYLSEEYAISA